MKSILIIVLFALPLLLSAQTEITTNDYRLLIGQQLPSQSNFTISEMIGHDASGYYALRSKKLGLFGRLSFYKNSGAINEKAKFFIEKYDYTLKLIKSVNLDELLKSKGYDYHFIEYQNGQINLYISIYNPDLKSRTLFVQKISNESLLPEGDPVLLYRNDDLKNSKFKGEYYASAISPNENYNFILVEKDVKNSDTRTFQLISFDKNFNKKWES